MIANVPQTQARPTGRNELERRVQARIQLAREHLIDFCAYVDPDAGTPDTHDTFVYNRYRSAHLRLIAQTIERAMDGSLWQDVPGDGKKVLLITTPPGHWKSSLVSRKFPAWFVGHQHMHGRPYQIILTSYNAALAQANNNKVLELIRDNPRYRHIFPNITLSPTEQSSEKWSLHGAAFTTCRAAGVGGGLTGYHGRVAVVDDPIKSRKDANSQAFLTTLWDWWKDELRTRLLDDDSFILGIWTRWSEGDPAGRIFESKKNGENDDQVVLVRLPALAETDAERESAAQMGLPVDPQDPLGRKPGEALCPDIESAREHQATQRSFPVTFDSLYQGRPRPAGGYIAGREQFNILPAAPGQHMRWVWGTDWAITEKETAPKGSQDPDYSVTALVGLWHPGGDSDETRIVIANILRKQANTHGAKKMVKDAALASSLTRAVFAGQDNIDKVAFNDLRHDEALLAYRFRNLDRKRMPGDKVTRAKTWLEDRLYAGQVYVVQGPWNEEFFNEVEAFPHGRHDDQVDAVSVAVHALGLGHRTRKANSAKVKGFGR